MDQLDCTAEETIEIFRKDGLPIEAISGGGTGREGVSKQIGCNATSGVFR
ncbi:MAG: hypothetical protein GY953_45525 [bacterium]|nr:hypothetical protein [bacterium]